MIFEERMKLTSKSEYALLALVYLARHRDEGFISVQTIASSQGIPQRFLEQILLILKRARFLRSFKGKHGGFQLIREPSSISLAEIIRLFDGALAPTESVSRYFYESTPIEKEEKLLAVFREVRDYVAQKMEKTMLSDVA
jgi:Rrf2 family transcriptional regulator, cysteine metabolism repressor